MNSLRIPQQTLYTDEAREIPQYESGSLGSNAEDLGIGFITNLPHIEGTVPLVKHILNSTCKNIM